jgi:hypothetical protein
VNALNLGKHEIPSAAVIPSERAEFASESSDLRLRRTKKLLIQNEQQILRLRTRATRKTAGRRSKAGASLRMTLLMYRADAYAFAW